MPATQKIVGSMFVVDIFVVPCQVVVSQSLVNRSAHGNSLHRDHLHPFRRMILSPERCNNRRKSASKTGSDTTDDVARGDEDTQKKRGLLISRRFTQVGRLKSHRDIL